MFRPIFTYTVRDSNLPLRDDVNRQLGIFYMSYYYKKGIIATSAHLGVALKDKYAPLAG